MKSTKKDSTGNSTTYFFGGTSNMLGYINKLRNSNTLVLNAGDDFQGTPISNFTRGRSQIELLNLFNLDAFVLGNHEFDYGQYSLDSDLSIANFDYLSANIYYNPKQSTFGKQWVIKNINGVKIGIIGITLPDLEGSTLPKNISEVKTLNTDSIIQAGITELKNEKCNLIILLSHEGVDDDKLIAEKYYNDVDIIVGGHSHTPLYQPVIDNGVIIVQAGSYSRWLGELDIKVDIDKDTVIKYYGKLIETVMDSSIYDKNAEEKVESMESVIDKELNVVIGNLASDWHASREKESNLGQFEAGVFKQKTKSDIAFINGGGMRKSLKKGEITIRDVWEINPFGNDIVTFSVTGKTLKQMMTNNILLRIETALDNKELEILDCTGLVYTFDSGLYPSDTLNILKSINVNGADVDDNKIYSIATNNFITSMFNRFFGKVDEEVKFKTTGLIDRDIIIDAIKEKKTIKSRLEHRIIDISKANKNSEN